MLSALGRVNSTSTERRVATLRDFTGHSAEEEAEDDEEHENLFAGGEKSYVESLLTTAI